MSDTNDLFYVRTVGDTVVGISDDDLFEYVEDSLDKGSNGLEVEELFDIVEEYWEELKH